jgi:Cysteine dioxygenase type I
MSLPVAVPSASSVPLRPLPAGQVVSVGSDPSQSSGPTRLRVPDLLHATDQAADDVLSGRCGHLLPTGGVPDAERWFTRIYGDGEVDIWLISWVPGHATELHDHGGSLGALTVLSGSLNEFRWEGRGLRRRRLDAGDQAGFPLGWVHDVVWAPRPVPTPIAGPATATAVQPTLSVHAYSPPLTAMSYYEITDRNTLRRQRTELTDQPEGQ